MMSTRSQTARIQNEEVAVTGLLPPQFNKGNAAKTLSWAGRVFICAGHIFSWEGRVFSYAGRAGYCWAVVGRTAVFVVQAAFAWLGGRGRGPRGVVWLVVGGGLGVVGGGGG